MWFVTLHHIAAMGSRACSCVVCLRVCVWVIEYFLENMYMVRDFSVIFRFALTDL